MLVGTIGYYALIFSLFFSVSILFLIIFDLKNNKEEINNKIFSFSLLQLIAIFVSFTCLIFSFIHSDISELKVPIFSQSVPLFSTKKQIEAINSNYQQKNIIISIY